jgi:hypothetical protein
MRSAMSAMPPVSRSSSDQATTLRSRVSFITRHDHASPRVVHSGRGLTFNENRAAAHCVCSGDIRRSGTVTNGTDIISENV